MKVFIASTAALLLTSAAAAGQPAPQPPFAAGKALGVSGPGGAYTPLSANVKVYGAVVNAESCVYDAERKLILAVNRAADQNQAPNDGFVSLIKPDGSVHTPRWIGATRNGLVLNHPFGSDVHDGKLYVADRDGGTADGAPSVSVVRWFDIGPARRAVSSWSRTRPASTISRSRRTGPSTPPRRAGATPVRRCGSTR